MTTFEKFASMTHLQRAAYCATESGRPCTLRHSSTEIEVFFPEGGSMLCAEVVTVPRNKSHFAHPDAVRASGTLMRVKTAIADAWFTWVDGKRHGQFPTREAAHAFATA